MSERAALQATTTARRFVHHETIHVRTIETLQFVDLTDLVARIVLESEIESGLANVQTRHTTTGIVINEGEPLLLDDMKDALERLAPRGLAYRHDDFSIRTVNLEPHEHDNGHAHCKALFLGSSETVAIHDGRLDLGRWQRLFLIELDRGRERTVSVTLVGC